MTTQPSPQAYAGIDVNPATVKAVVWMEIVRLFSATVVCADVRTRSGALAASGALPGARVPPRPSPAPAA